MPALPYALQLYSVRDYAEKDPESTLLQVKEMGYDFVECAGFYGMSADTYAQLLAASGLKAVSMHVGYDQVTGDTDAVIADALALGLEYVVVPWLGGEVCPDRQAWLEAARRMDGAGARMKSSGIMLCYHNHAHEFERIDDETVFHLIFGAADAANLAIQLDTCWATVGGTDPVELLRNHRGRVPLVHVKDCKRLVPGNPVVFTELGNGIMDWERILPAAIGAGAQWLIVEQDESEVDSLESASVSAAFMKNFVL